MRRTCGGLKMGLGVKFGLVFFPSNLGKSQSIGWWFGLALWGLNPLRKWDTPGKFQATHKEASQRGNTTTFGVPPPKKQETPHALRTFGPSDLRTFGPSDLRTFGCAHPVLAFRSAPGLGSVPLGPQRPTATAQGPGGEGPRAAQVETKSCIWICSSYPEA